VRVSNEAGATGGLHLKAVLHRGKCYIGASSSEDAGEDNRLHLLRAHGDGHENLRNTEQEVSLLGRLTRKFQSIGRPSSLERTARRQPPRWRRAWRPPVPRNAVAVIEEWSKLWLLVEKVELPSPWRVVKSGRGESGTARALLMAGSPGNRGKNTTSLA
jgi:hypothetical protein